MTKTVYRYDDQGYYVGTDRAFESPLEKGVFHIPAFCTELEPLEAKEGFKRKWNGSGWEYEEIPKEPEPPEPPELTEEEKQEQIKNYLKAVVQNWMDKTVQEREYDGVHTACLYVNSPIEKFQKEGQACLEWMSAVWVRCYAIQDEVLAGTREIPTEEELIAELPVLEW